MPTVSMIAEAAEAVCGALHKTGFVFLGESENHIDTYFTRGHEKPKIMRVCVHRNSLGFVEVQSEWANVSLHPAGPIVKGEAKTIVRCNGNRMETEADAETAVTGALTIFQNLLTGTGVASKEALAHLDFSE